MKTFLITLLSLVALFESCCAQGAPWTEEEFKIIAEKVWILVAKNNVANNEFKKMYPKYKKPSNKVTPNAKKVNGYTMFYTIKLPIYVFFRFLDLAFMIV